MYIGIVSCVQTTYPYIDHRRIRIFLLRVSFPPTSRHHGDHIYIHSMGNFPMRARCAWCTRSAMQHTLSMKNITIIMWPQISSYKEMVFRLCYLFEFVVDTGNVESLCRDRTVYLLLRRELYNRVVFPQYSIQCKCASKVDITTQNLALLAV